MGVWGPGLYSGDFALDLRATISALSRLPFDGEKIRDLARETERQAAEDPQNPDHTTFWLVLADRFQRRGIRCDDVTEKALALMEHGADTAMLRELGMSPDALRKRARTLSELRERLQQGPASQRRATLKKPQPLIMAVGDIYAYPTSRGVNINPYAAPPVKGWSGRPQDAWGALLVIDAGLAFDYLAWYTIMVAKNEFDAKPHMNDLLRSPWTFGQRFGHPGTCSSTHFKRMELELIGRVAVNREAVEANFGRFEPGIQAAVCDISIANGMKVITKNPADSRRLMQPYMERTPSLELREFAAPI